MEEALAKEYVYPPLPTTHGLVDEDCDYDCEDTDGSAYPPYE